jgi:F-type H+-transporting ATPase subunit b
MSLTFGDASMSLASAASSASGAVSLDFDLAFLAQMVAFTILVFVLKPILFDPLLKLYEERERRTDGAKLLARKMDEEAGEMLQRYESQLENVRRTATEERERLRAEGAKLEQRILADARAEAAKILDEGRARIAAEAQATRAELKARAAELSADVARVVLGREVA